MDTSLREMSDRLQILNLSGLYCHLIDDGLFDRLDEIFTADGTFSAFGRSHHGLDAIALFLSRSQSPERRGRHMVSAPVVNLDGDQALARTDVAFFTRDARSWTATVVGRYDDELRRTSAGWRLHVRDFRAL